MIEIAFIKTQVFCECYLCWTTVRTPTCRNRVPKSFLYSVYSETYITTYYLNVSNKQIPRCSNFSLKVLPLTCKNPLS